MRYSIDAVVESFWWFNCVLLLYIKVLQCNIMSIVESKGKLQKIKFNGAGRSSPMDHDMGSSQWLRLKEVVMKHCTLQNFQLFQGNKGF